jgi:hypothetical protein
MDTKKQHKTFSAMVEYLRNRFHPADRKAGAFILLTSVDVVSHRVATRLIEAGFKVRVGFDSYEADSQLLQDLRRLGVPLVPFSWDDESTYSEALQDAKTVFCVVSQSKGSVKRFYAFFDACRKKGVKHFVKQ